MKVYSWKTLFVTIFVGGALIIYEAKNIMEGEMISLLFLMFWVYLFIKGLWVSFTREGFETDERDGEISKTVTKELFGKWSFIGPWAGIVLIILGGVICLLMPSKKWICILLFILGLVYQIRVNLLLRRRFKIERRKYF